MNRTRWTAVVAGAALGVVGLTTGAIAAAAPAVSGTQTVTSDWGTGYCADVRITTSSTTAVRWTVPVYVSGGTVNSVWNGVATPAGDHVDVSGAAWNSTVSAAAPTTFGYCAGGRPAAGPSPTASPTATPTPTVSASLSASPSPTATASGSGLKLSYTVSPWSGGGTVNVTVTNNGPAITGWTVDIPWAVTVSSVWSGVNKSTSGHVVVTNETWNGKLGQGASATFGMSVTGSIPAASTCTATTNRGVTPCAIGAGPAPTPTTTSAPPTGSPTPTASPTTSPTPTPTPTQTVDPLPANYGTAPYVDLSGWPTPNLTQIRAASGLSTFTAAFITSAGGCTPAWGGYPSLGMTSTGDQIGAMNKSITDVQAAGGKVIVSLGGAFGSELALTCTDVTSLKNAYKSVVDKYNLTRIDFDIEGGAQNDRAANVRRGQALAALQAERKAAGKPLTVTFTLPVMPTGLTQDGINVLKDTQAGGAAVDLVNVMAMDYGGANTQMGQSAIDAANATAGQIGFLYPGTTAAQRLPRVGVTPMIGENDVQNEVFTLADATKLRTWATANKLGLVSWWSVTRDTPCPNNGAYASPTCSGTSNPTWAYAKALAG